MLKQRIGIYLNKATEIRTKLILNGGWAALGIERTFKILRTSSHFKGEIVSL